MGSYTLHTHTHKPKVKQDTIQHSPPRITQPLPMCLPVYEFSLNMFIIIMCTCLFLCVCVSAHPGVLYKSNRTICRNQFSPSHVCILSVKLRVLALAASVFSHKVILLTLFELIIEFSITFLKK